MYHDHIVPLTPLIRPPRRRIASSTVKKKTNTHGKRGPGDAVAGTPCARARPSSAGPKPCFPAVIFKSATRETAHLPDWAAFLGLKLSLPLSKAPADRDRRFRGGYAARAQPTSPQLRLKKKFSAEKRYFSPQKRVGHTNATYIIKAMRRTPAVHTS